LITFTEEFLSSLVKTITGSYKIKIHPNGHETEKEVEIDFTPPFRKISMMEELEKKLGFKTPENLESEEANKLFNELCKKHNVDCAPPRSTSRLIDKLVGEFIESECLNPTFLLDHP
jgi:lysyl-tRNA synthetase class 2